MTASPVDAEPLATWEASNGRGPFREHLAEASAWAVTHLGQEVANRTVRVDFHLLNAPVAVLYQVVTDEDGHKLANPETGGLWLAEPVVQMLDELPPAHLLGR